MKFLGFFQYVYLVFALLFLYTAYGNYVNNESFLMPILLAGLAVFIFFFRKRFRKKFEDKHNQ